MVDYPKLPARYRLALPDHLAGQAVAPPVAINFRQIDRWADGLPFNAFIAANSSEYPTNTNGAIVYDIALGQLLVGNGTTWTPIASLSSFAPTGSMMDFAGTAAPTGWNLCDGSSQLRAGAFAALFAVIGTTYGAADGTHFNLPDFRGRVGVGLDNMGGSDAARLSVANTLGGNGGEENHTLITAELASHNHTQNSHNHGGDVTDPGFVAGVVATSVAAGAIGVYQRTASSPALHIPSDTATNNTAGSGTAHNNMQPYILINKIIKT